MTNHQYPTTKAEVITFVNLSSAETIALIEHALMLLRVESKVAKLGVSIRQQQNWSFLAQS